MAVCGPQTETKLSIGARDWKPDWSLLQNTGITPPKTSESMHDEAAGSVCVSVDEFVCVSERLPDWAN